jgi:succinate dehydrogenase hydrophobic anchor subunit
MKPTEQPPVLTREWMSGESWRGASAGMWAWLIQRVAAVALVAVIVLHVVNPFRRGVQAALLGLVLVHGLLGVRSLLLDVGLPVRWHRTLLALALVLAVALFAAAWQWRWY